MMKLEYLADGAAECPLVRLYEFDPSQAQQLRELGLIAAGEREAVALQNEEWVEAVSECCLGLRVGSRNYGVRQVKLQRFECILTLEGWSNVGDLLAPFAETHESAFQWLNNDGKIALLISQDGHW